LCNITSFSGTISNPFTYQGGIFDSQTGFYNTGSGYYDPATGQAFGCQDKGWWDPGEDLCGRDEANERGTSTNTQSGGNFYEFSQSTGETGGGGFSGAPVVGPIEGIDIGSVGGAGPPIYS